MSATFDSIYPDFLRTGLGRLHTLGVGHDLLALFSALEHFRHDLQAQEAVPDILRVTHQYVAGLNLCHTHAFYLVEPANFSFELGLCEPSSTTATMELLIKAEIKAGKFAWALRQNAPVFFDSRVTGSPVRGVFHSLGVASHTVGMFCGLLRADPVPAQEVSWRLLAMLLGNSADALAAARKTADLKHEINTLSGLLPICAWCKRIRDDQGYWKQIESYIESRSAATFSHSVCPSCTEKLKGEILAGKG